MMSDLIDLYDRASAWTASKIPAAAKCLDDPTPCEEWNVRALLNHLIGGQEFFQAAARGEQPTGGPDDIVGDDPAKQYEDGRRATLEAFRQPGALEKAGFFGAIAYVDQLIHGWDLAKATGQDATMPADVAEAAYAQMSANPNKDGTPGLFKPSVVVPDEAPTQVKIIALSGRTP
jgi:uncharacterized protein (TIGR03086 family)